MSVKVAINGFGRIGRLAFRQMFGAEGYEVVAINDLTSPEMLANLLKYDTAQGGYCGRIGENLHTVDFKAAEYEEDGKTVKVPGAIIVDGKEITIYAMPNAKDLPWGELDVDVVLECTGFYCSKAKSQAHIDAGAKKVVISAPAGNDLKTIVYSVNEKTLTKDDQVISAASCTTNCLAPVSYTHLVYADRSFSFITKTPPAAVLIKKAAGINTASGKPNKEKVATLTAAQVEEIAKTKMPDLNAASLEAACSMVRGTCRSMGVTVEG